jgi:hypothetical protein
MIIILSILGLLGLLRFFVAVFLALKKQWIVLGILSELV